MTLYYEGQFDDTRFFLSYDNPDRMLLEMNFRRGTRIDSIYYIKNLGPYAFEEPYKTYYTVLLSGDYHTSVDGVGTDVSLGLDGKIKGHPNWVGYKMKKARYIPPEETHTLYFLVDFTLDDTEVPLELAFLYDDKAKVWEGYKYKITPPAVLADRKSQLSGWRKKCLNSTYV